MERNKKVCLEITLIGTTIIIITSVIISLINYKENKELNLLKKDLVSITRSCVKDNICTNDTITLKDLSEYNYLTNDLKKRTENYDDTSFIIFSLKEVYLKEKN